MPTPQDITVDVEFASWQSFGLLLKCARKAANLSQTELAERAGMSRSAISALERGLKHRPHKYTVGALADALRLAPFERAALLAAARAPATTSAAIQYAAPSKSSRVR